MEIRRLSLCRGFSLIEMIIAISVLGILSASTAVFLRGPITSYFDTERRANLANAGELAMAKMAQEISRAVPNSVRVTVVGSGFYLEFLPLISGFNVVGEGFYNVPSPGPGPSFTAGTPKLSFDVICTPSPPISIPCPTGAPGNNWVVINNDVANTYLDLGPDTDVWVDPLGVSSRTRLTNIAGSIINHSAKVFVGPAPGSASDYRFQIAADPVTYFCDPLPVPGNGTLTRYSGYGAPSAVQPQPSLSLLNVLATQITACNAQVLRGDLKRAQVVALTLTFTNAGDSLNLYQTIRVEPLP